MAKGSLVTEVELARIQRGFAMCMEALVYNMAAAMGGRGRSPWAVKDHLWLLHELIEIVAKHQLNAAKNSEQVAWSSWKPFDTKSMNTKAIADAEQILSSIAGTE